MTDYKAVTEALEAGTEPRHLCMTCPWDRNCLAAPSMTKAEIERQKEEAKVKDAEAAEKARAEGKDAGFPMGELITIMAIGGRDTTAPCCPVLALRLRSSAGRPIAENVRELMREWDDDAA